MKPEIINLLKPDAGGEEHFAFNPELAQLIFGPDSFISLLVFACLMRELAVYNGCQFIHQNAQFTHSLATSMELALPDIHSNPFLLSK